MREFKEKDKKGKKGKILKSENDEIGQLRGVLINWIRRINKTIKRGKEDVNL